MFTFAKSQLPLQWRSCSMSLPTMTARTMCGDVLASHGGGLNPESHQPSPRQYSTQSRTGCGGGGCVWDHQSVGTAGRWGLERLIIDRLEPGIAEVWIKSGIACAWGRAVSGEKQKESLQRQALCRLQSGGERPCAKRKEKGRGNKALTAWNCPRECCENYMCGGVHALTPR
ncbi:hypothetical protein DL89DRAFT_174474 [Linderina pennispora]|uniref:Uncharacterized protein n=1 Tax=Linderina pennispora TaxID=61395 RepID=A0A1Y1W704_9FUNG|nr:uncharacterized protein DL89DRAFT_174474 [Linderina pennispora]ORX69301.1 hypothetical protein DL89DRAFT_174474 [Linderina pennispora]